jgi:hypothetical protein
MPTVVSVVALALCMLSSTVHAQRVAPTAVVHVAAHVARSSEDVARPRAASAQARRGMPAWLKWGLVGAVAGAVTFPLLGSMASDSNGDAGRDAVAGAAAGFVIVGGSVALWQAMCGPDSSSRRAGLCGR